MIGKFENGQEYQFYVTLTTRIQDLVRQLEHDRPGSLRYRGMDFSHAFESLLYFSTVLDEALNALYCGGSPGEAPPLSNDLAVLLARHWFGTIAARPFEAQPRALRTLMRAGNRRLNWTAAYSTPPPKIFQANLPPRCDVMLYARSTRFADYLAPLAARLAQRHAFLVPSEAHDVQLRMAADGSPFAAAAPAGAALRPQGSLLARYAPHLAFFADGLDKVLRQIRPRVIVLPEGNSPDDEVVNLAGQKLGIPVVCLQQGWSPILHAGFCNLHYDAMMVWGDGFSDLLAATNPRQRFIATGNHVLTSKFRPPAERPPGILFFHQDIDRGLSGRRGSDMMLDLAQKAARAWPHIPILYRPHPLVPLESNMQAMLEQAKVVIQPPSAMPLAQALDQVRVTVSIYSTTILESAAAGALPLIFNMTTMPRFWPDMDSTGAAIEVRTTEEAFDTLGALVSDDRLLVSHTPAMADFATHYFRARGTQALDNILAELERIAR